MCICVFVCVQVLLTPSLEPSSMPSRYLSATSSRASLGQSTNQSMEVQLTSAGYWRIRFLSKGTKRRMKLNNTREIYLLEQRDVKSSRTHLKSSPTGLMQRITCRLLLTRSIRYRKRESGVCSTLSRLASSASALHTCRGKAEKILRREEDRHISLSFSNTE